jgi:hypothetical protein
MVSNTSALEEYGVGEIDSTITEEIMSVFLVMTLGFEDTTKEAKTMVFVICLYLGKHDSYQLPDYLHELTSQSLSKLASGNQVRTQSLDLFKIYHTYSHARNDPFLQCQPDSSQDLHSKIRKIRQERRS